MFHTITPKGPEQLPLSKMNIAGVGKAMLEDDGRFKLPLAFLKVHLKMELNFMLKMYSLRLWDLKNLFLK